jgi:hypothetical protein
VSSFNADWLAQREPVDDVSRPQALIQKIVDALPQQEPLDILDVATGTGANVRYLMDRLPGSQRWLLVDNDEGLLEQLPDLMKTWGATREYEVFESPNGVSMRGPKGTRLLETRRTNIFTLDPSIFTGRALVTTSALLDLVSDDWLRIFIPRCREANATVLFALSYDGRIKCEPMESEDFTIRDLVNRHQRTDKGFGPSLGPEAVRIAEGYLQRLGYRVRREASDWRISPTMVHLQKEILAGWAEAAVAASPAQASMVEGWHGRRLEHVDQGRSRLIVGHTDLAGWLPKPAAESPAPKA